jgi:DNA polymerase-3 subunit beta
MRIFCEKDVLAAGLTMVQRAVAAKSPLPSLKGILLTARDNQLTLSATDLEFGLSCTFTSQCEENGSIVLPARMLTDFVRRLPAGHVTLASDEGNPNLINVRSGSIKFDLTGFPAEEFPQLPGLKNIDQAKIFSISEGLLREMLVQTEVALAREETRPILTGMLMELDEQRIKLVATDGHRLAFRQTVAELGEITRKAVIPGKVVSELVKILNQDFEKKIEVSLGESDVVFKTGILTLSSRLMDGKYPPYQQIIPSDFKTSVTADGKELVAALERAEVISREGGNNLVRLEMDEMGIRINASSPDVGSMDEHLPASVQGETLSITFNVRLLLDSLKNLGSEKVSLDFTGSFSPALFKPIHDHNCLHLVLPVRLN